MGPREIGTKRATRSWVGSRPRRNSKAQAADEARRAALDTTQNAPFRRYCGGPPSGPGACGGKPTGVTHDDRSNRMNSIASSSGESFAVATQPVGHRRSWSGSRSCRPADVEIAEDDAAAVRGHARVVHRRVERHVPREVLRARPGSIVGSVGDPRRRDVRAGPTIASLRPFATGLRSRSLASSSAPTLPSHVSSAAPSGNGLPFEQRRLDRRR